MLNQLAVLLTLGAGPSGRVFLYSPLDSVEGYSMEESFLSHFRSENRGIEVVERRLLGAEMAEAQVQEMYGARFVSASSARNLPRARQSEAHELAAQPGHAVFTITWGNKIPALVDGGLIAPVDGLLPKQYWADFYPRVLDTVTYQGRIWSLPLEATPYALFCNLEHFCAGGVSLPTTWEETLAAAQALTRDTDGDGTPNLWGYTQCTYQFPLLLWCYGISIIREDGLAGFADPPAVEVSRLYWALRECSPPHVEFERGDVAMKLSTYDDINRYHHLDYAVIPLPHGTCRANSLGASGSTMGMVLLNGSDPEIAGRFLAFWARPDIYLRWCVWTHAVALRKSVRDSAAYQRFLLRVPEMRAFDGDLECSVPRPVIPEYDAIHEVIAGYTRWVNVQPVEPSLQELQARLDEAAAQANALLTASR